MLTEAELQKKWESLTFTDDFIFSRVMHDETICRQMADARYDGYDEGLSIGLEQGAYKTKLETARSLLQDGFSTEMIAKYTSLPLETVLELAQTK